MTPDKNPMRKARRKAKRTLREAAEFLRVSERTVMRWELYQTKPGAESVILLAKLYRCHPSDLVEVSR